MPYANAEQVRDVLVRDRERRAGTAASLPDDTLNGHVETASSEVDGVLAALGHRVPLQQVPTLIRDVVVAIAGWMADLTYRQGKAHESRMDPVVQRYDWAQLLLQQWAKRERLVPGLPNPDDDSGLGGGDIGRPINPLSPGLTAPLVYGYPGYPLDNDYDPDFWRWGRDRGWL